MKWLNKKGFTLLELLVVVLIIGILSGIAIPQYTKVVEKARLAEPLTVIPQLQRALDIYMLSEGLPTNNTHINFLSRDPDAELDIDIMKNFHCVHEGTYGHGCLSKYFSHIATCNKNGCWIQSCRFSKEYPNQLCYGSDYELYLYKRKNDDFWEKTCYWENDKEYICQHLESQGFDRQCC